VQNPTFAYVFARHFDFKVLAYDAAQETLRTSIFDVRKQFETAKEELPVSAESVLLLVGPLPASSPLLDLV
jgi:hypothetical protein